MRLQQAVKPIYSNHLVYTRIAALSDLRVTKHPTLPGILHQYLLSFMSGMSRLLRYACERRHVWRNERQRRSPPELEKIEVGLRS
jgi:hypothetical protein